MKAEEFIKRLEDIIKEHGGGMEIVVYDEARRYLSPAATVVHISGIDKIVVM
jgi:hypothetical protein